MQHLDEDDLVMLALDELPDTMPVMDHLTDCVQCQQELHSWRLTIGTARDTDAQLGLEPAPAHLWEAIAAEIATLSQVDDLPARHEQYGSRVRHSYATSDLAGDSGRAPSPESVATPDRRATSERPVGAAVTRNTPAGAMPAGTPPASSLQQHRDRRARERRDWKMPLIAAAVAAVISGAGVYFAVGSSDATEPKPQLEAVANLEPLSGGTGRLGTAELVKSNGIAWVQVQATDLPPIPGSYEVWLFGADGKMVSLGVLAAGLGNFAVPQGIDPGSYSVIDISNEPADGNPAHSKNSVARGKLA